MDYPCSDAVWCLRSRYRRSPVISRPPQSGWQALRRGPGGGVGWGSGAAPPGLAAACWWRTKGWPSAHSKGRSLVAWFMGRTNGFPPQRWFWRVFSVQSFFMEVSCKGFGWVEGSGLGNMWRWWLGVHPSHGVCRASSKPSTAIRKAPMESEGLCLPPRAVGLPSLCSAQPRTGPAGGIATQEINTNRGQEIHPK